MGIVEGPFQNITSIFKVVDVNPCDDLDAANYQGLVMAFSYNPEGQVLWIQRSVAIDEVAKLTDPQGIIYFCEAAVSWDLSACEVVDGIGDSKYIYYPAGTDASDHELWFSFTWGATVLIHVRGFIGPEFGASGSETEGLNNASYWTDNGIVQSVFVVDKWVPSGYYNK